MTTNNLIAGAESGQGKDHLYATNPSSKEQLDGAFVIATDQEIDQAANAALEAWHTYKLTSGAAKAKLLRTIADNIENLGDTLVHRAMAESGLPEGRIKGERGRTCGQLRLFASLVEEGSWVRATIDAAQPDRQPMPRVDIRKMYQALGPVAIFGASNFPLAFSTAGGDTASALAAGCPVVVKGHPSHLGTHALVSEAITAAVAACGLPAGTFSTVTGGAQQGASLVQHPAIKAVGFTGSLGGGNAIMRASYERAEPIPVYAEMGSINPIFLLPSVIESDQKKTADQLANSINMGVGQFCTNPGILVIPPSSAQGSFLEVLGQSFDALKAHTMLNEGIYSNYESTKSTMINHDSVEAISHKTTDDTWAAQPALAKTTAQAFVNNPSLHHEVFGPFSMAVVCESAEDVKAVAHHLEGQLTATMMGSDAEIESHADVVDILREKAGRVIFNGVPTGVEVGHAMHHGGPYPSASTSKYTSVGTDAILRFVRPICLQNAPQSILPDALKDDNPLQIWRMVDGTQTKAAI
jgi:NADP-dependent aldehyde dehydrogenase